MLNKRAISIADAYWAAFFRCPPEQIFAEPLRVVPHGPELSGYHGVFALFRNGGALVSIPPDRSESLRLLLSGLAQDCSFASLAAALASESHTMVGPAYVGYATQLTDAPSHAARELGPEDAPALQRFQSACGEIDWETGGVSGALPCSGVYEGSELVAAASYEDWVGAIAHICVVTQRDFRGRGFGRSVVAHLAQRAIRVGLLPQYRTLEANQPSMRIAGSLGFQRYAVSLALRLKPVATAVAP